MNLSDAQPTRRLDASQDRRDAETARSDETAKYTR